MPLLGVLVTRFPPVASSPTSSLPRPSASSTPFAGTRSNTCTSAHWSGMSGCLAYSTPHRFRAQHLCPRQRRAHADQPPRQQLKFPAQLRRHHSLHNRGPRRTSTLRSIQQQQAYRSEQSSHSVRIIRESPLQTDSGL